MSCLCTMCMKYHRGQKRVNDSLELELQVVVKSTEELRTKPQTL